VVVFLDFVLLELKEVENEYVCYYDYEDWKITMYLV